MVAAVWLCVRVRAVDGLSVVGVCAAWVWAVGRSGGLLWLLVVGCVWRIPSGSVVAGGVARACPCRVRVGGPSWWLWWCPGQGAGVGAHGGGGGAVGGRRDRYPACQVWVWWALLPGGASWACLDGVDTPEGVGGVSPAEGIGEVALAVCLPSAVTAVVVVSEWLATLPAPVRLLGPATLSAPPKFLVTVRPNPFGYRCAPARRRVKRGGAGCSLKGAQPMVIFWIAAG